MSKIDWETGVTDGMRCVVCKKIIDGEVPGLLRACTDPACQQRHEEACMRLLRDIFKKRLLRDMKGKP